MTLSPIIMGAATVLAKEAATTKKSFLASIFGEVLRAIYNFLSDVFAVEPANFSYWAMAIILMTLLVKLILFPLSFKAAKSTKMMQDPRIKELQVKYKNDPQTLANKQRELYKELGINPLSGCLPLLIQFPIIIALFNIIRQPFVYVFPEPGFYDAMAKNMLWIPNLDIKDPFMFGLPLVAALATLVQSKLTQQTQTVGDANQQAFANSMLYMGPIMIFIFAVRYPAALALYWAVSNVFSILQQLIINKSHVGEKEMKKA